MPPSLTILHLLPDLEGGGVETDVAGLSAACVAAGHRCVVVSGGGRMVARIEAAGAQHIRMPIGRKSPLTLLCIPKIRRILSEYKVDIVHAHSRVPAWVGFLATRGRPGAHFVTSMHGLNTPGFFSAVMLRGERVIAVSQTVRAFIAKSYPRADLAKVEVIPRGVEAAAFPHGHRPSPEWRTRWEAEYPLLRGRFVMALVGRLTRLKGHHHALAALRLLLERGVDAHLLVVGGEDPRRRAYAAEVRAAAAAFGDRVTFTGQRNDVREVLASCSAALSTSIKPESFGLAPLEALSLGVPVVGFDHGGVGEVMGAVYPEGLVPVGDIAAMAERLAALARGELGRPAAQQAFPLATTHACTLALYRTLVDASAS